MTLKIRKAEIGDEELLGKEFWYPLAREMEKYHEVNELKEDADREASKEFRKRIEDEKYSFFFIEKSDQEVGYISVEEKERESRKKDTYIDVLGLFVKQEHRGEGLGTELIEKAKDFAKEREADYITVSAEWRNDRARKFYRKNGFEEKKIEFVQMVD